MKVWKRCFLFSSSRGTLLTVSGVPRGGCVGAWLQMAPSQQDVLEGNPVAAVALDATERLHAADVAVEAGVAAVEGDADRIPMVPADGHVQLALHRRTDEGMGDVHQLGVASQYRRGEVGDPEVEVYRDSLRIVILGKVEGARLSGALHLQTRQRAHLLEGHFEKGVYLETFSDLPEDIEDVVSLD